MEKSSKKAKKIILIILCVFLVIFIILNIVWLYFRYTYYTKVVKESEYFEYNNFFTTEYEYQVPEGDEYEYTLFYITFPSYLNYDYGYGASTPLDYNEDFTGFMDSYSFFISIKPSLSGEYSYTIDIDDLKTATENGTADYDSYTVEVDENMEVIRELSYGSEEVFNEAKDELSDFFEKTKEVFGL